MSRSSELERWSSRARRFAAPLATLVGLLIAALAIRVIAHSVNYPTLMKALRHTSPVAVGEAIGATGVSYAALIARDALALVFVGRSAPALAVLLAGFCGCAMGNAVGFGTLTGGAVRYRIYASVGIRPDQVAELMIFMAVSFLLSLAALGGGAVLYEAPVLAKLLHVGVEPLRLGGGASLAASFVALSFTRNGRRPVFGQSVRLPGRRLLAAEVALSIIDVLAAGATFWALLPAHAIAFPTFAAIYAAALAIGVVLHMPGGLGVFEAVVLVALNSVVAPEKIAAALILYRLIYFVLPLILSTALLAVFEIYVRAGSQISWIGRRFVGSAARLAPSYLGVIAFGIGVMLVASGATPAFEHRLNFLSLHLPLWVLETSHFIGSLAGVLFLFAARGLMHRLDGAWWLAIVMASISLAFSLAKGLAYIEVGVLLFFILVLLATRQQFGRRASLLHQPFTLPWLAALLSVLLGSILILVFSFEDIRYAHVVWWQFEFDAQAPRALRATVGVCLFGIALGLFELLRPPRGIVTPPSEDDLARAAEIIRSQDRSDPMLVLMGDKSLLFSSSGHAFLMYAREGRSWVALFDPVGPRTEWPELIWQFVELAASHGGRAAFYQVRPENLPLYLDAGLEIMKLGEEARISLPDFTLEGRDRTHLRYALKRGEREELSFEFVPAGEVSQHFDAVAEVSANWLRSRGASEKGFSVAGFQAAFVKAQSLALVRHQGRPVAFATLMVTGRHREATIGLMRHIKGAPAVTMEYLFTKLILAAKEAGYEELSLGMAPLSGFTEARLATFWHRLMRFIWRYGNRLYNFQGLRLFKGKFAPRWEPRYLAASGMIGPYLTLANVTALVGAASRSQ